MIEWLWYRRSWVNWLFAPLALLFALLTTARRRLYRAGWIRSYRAPVPVIVVGNITVGGNGKTPVVLWLVDLLTKSGYRPGVVSRGYGGKAPHYPYLLHPAATAIEAETPTLYDFPSAFRRLIGGERIARQGWNGKDMWLSVSNLEVNTVPAERFWSKHNRAHALQNGGSAEVPPCVTLKNAKGQVQMGWLPSQEDLFANDWVVLSNGNLHEVAAI